MSLDVFQQVTLLSYVSNLVHDRKESQTALQQALQIVLTSTIPTIGAGWQLAWGPVVWKNKPDEATTGPDNAWYIAFNPALTFEDGSVHPTYVISIAGTPPESEYVWTEQNFAVSSVSDFRAWVANGIQSPPVVVPAKNIVRGEAYIATGTVNAVHLLLTTPAPSGAPAAGTTLLDFIANLDHSGSPRVISTGASLGGALSPSLALALVSVGVLPPSSTLTYPIAGPSPGNIAFTDLFVDTLPERKSAGAASYQGWNLNLVNTLDIVPQAWSSRKQASPKQNLSNIPSIYGLPLLPVVFGATAVFTSHSLLSGVLYHPLPSQHFTGSPPPETPKSLEEFLEIVVLQHIRAYLEEAGVTIPPLTVPGSITLGEKSEAEKRFDYPIIAALEWAREHPEEAQKEIGKVEGSPEVKEILGNA